MPSKPPASDEDLLSRFLRKGDREALGDLFIRHAPFAFGSAYALLRDSSAAEEAVQEAFLKVIGKAPTYDPGRPFKPWLRTIVVRTALDHRRARGTRNAFAPQAAVSSPAEDPMTRLIDQETRAKLRLEMDRLPEDLRSPLVLHYQVGCSYEEIAETLRMPRGTVATRLAAARERLKVGLATAGVVLVAGVSLEEILAREASSIPVPAALPVALSALAATADPVWGYTKRGPFPRFLKSWKGAAAVLLVAAAGGAFLSFREKPIPSASGSAGLGRSALGQPGAPRSSGNPSSLSSVPAQSAAASEPEVSADEPRKTVSLSGRITCRETGAPIPDACVELFLSEPPEPPEIPGVKERLESGKQGQSMVHRESPVATALTDAAGRYVLGPAPVVGHYRLNVEALGFAGHLSHAPAKDRLLPLPDLFQSDFSGFGRIGSPFSPLAVGETRAHDIALSRGWGVKVKLLHPGGHPAPLDKEAFSELVVVLKAAERKTDLEFYPGWQGKPGFHPRGAAPVKLYDDGSFEIGGLDPERFPPRDVALAVRARGFRPVEIASLDRFPRKEDRFQVEIDLDPGRRISGRLLRPDGSPPATDAYVYCDEQHVKVSADGSFVLQGLPRGKPLSLWADAGGTGNGDDRWRMMNAPLEIPAGYAEASVSPVLDADAQVSGRVLDAEGRPLGGAAISARVESVQRAATTDADGCFIVTGLPSWQGLSVLCEFPGRIPVGWKNVPAGTRGIDISLLEFDRHAAARGISLVREKGKVTQREPFLLPYPQPR